MSYLDSMPFSNQDPAKEKRQNDRISELEKRIAELEQQRGCAACEGRGWIVRHPPVALAARSVPTEQIRVPLPVHVHCPDCDGTGKARP